MNLSKPMQAVLRDIRKQLVMGGSLLGLALVLLVTSYHEIRSLVQAHDKAERQMMDAMRTAREMRDELESARKYLYEYETLTKHAVLGEFRKQTSLDQVDRLLQAGWVQPRNYALAAQATVDHAAASALQNHLLLRHSLSFDAGLPHELRLVDLVEALSSEAVTGLTTVESCEISRASNEGRSDIKRDEDRPLSGRCTFNWYRFTVKEGDTTMGSPSGPGTPPGSGTGLRPAALTSPLGATK